MPRAPARYILNCWREMSLSSLKYASNNLIFTSSRGLQRMLLLYRQVCVVPVYLTTRYDSMYVSPRHAGGERIYVRASSSSSRSMLRQCESTVDVALYCCTMSMCCMSDPNLNKAEWSPQPSRDKCPVFSSYLIVNAKALRCSPVFSTGQIYGDQKHY